MQKNNFIRKIRLISRLITSQPGKQTIAIHILPDISRSRGNQTMKFGQLIEYNMRNIFLKKSCIKWVWWRNYTQTLFWKTKIEGISGLTASTFIQFVFILCQVEGYRNMLKLSGRPLTFTSYKGFLKNQKRSRTTLPSHFLHDFWWKIFLLIYFINWPNFIVFTSWDIGQYV